MGRCYDRWTTDDHAQWVGVTMDILQMLVDNKVLPMTNHKTRQCAGVTMDEPHMTVHNR